MLIEKRQNWKKQTLNDETASETAFSINVSVIRREGCSLKTEFMSAIFAALRRASAFVVHSFKQKCRFHLHNSFLHFNTNLNHIFVCIQGDNFYPCQYAYLTYFNLWMWKAIIKKAILRTCSVIISITVNCSEAFFASSYIGTWQKQMSTK